MPVRGRIYAKNLNAARNTATRIPTEESPGTRRVEAGLLGIAASGPSVVVGLPPAGLLLVACSFRLMVGTASFSGDLKGSRVPMHFAWFSLQSLWPVKSSGWFSMHCA